MAADKEKEKILLPPKLEKPAYDDSVVIVDEFLEEDDDFMEPSQNKLERDLARQRSKLSTKKVTWAQPRKVVKTPAVSSTSSATSQPCNNTLPKKEEENGKENLFPLQWSKERPYHIPSTVLPNSVKKKTIGQVLELMSREVEANEVHSTNYFIMPVYISP